MSNPPKRPVVPAVGLAIALAYGAAGAGAADEQEEDWKQDFAVICSVPLRTEGKLQPTLRIAGVPSVPRAGGGGAMDFLQPYLSHYLKQGAASGASDDPVVKASSLAFDGATDALAGRYDAAQPKFESCERIGAQGRHPLVEASCANNLGVVLGARGRYAEAQAAFERALKRFGELADRGGLPPAEPQRTRRGPDPGTADRFAGLLGTRLAIVGVERSLLNLGHLAVAVGQTQEAMRRFQQALDSHAAASAPACKAAAARDLAGLYRQLGRDADAQAVVARHGAVRTPPEGASVIEMGTIALGSGLQAPAATPADAAADRDGSAQPFADPMGTRDEAALQQMMSEALRDERAGRAARAVTGQARVALRAAAAQRPEIEAAAQASLMRLHAAAGQPGAAIHHGKRAANLMQDLRSTQSDAGLSRAARRSYLRDRQQVYAQLAQLLIDQGRLGEAESLLRTLKEDEGRQFQRAQGQAAHAALTETAQEKAARAPFEAAARTLRRLDDERNAAAANFSAGLLQFPRAKIEQLRLDAGTSPLVFLEQMRKSGKSALGDEMLRVPIEYQRDFAALFADRGRRLAAGLRHLAEDAPQFTETKPTPLQLSQIAESLRRVDEVVTAMAPVLERMRRQPGPTALQDARRQMQQVPRLSHDQVQGYSAAATLAAGTQGLHLQQATGIAMSAYLRALGGQPHALDTAGLDQALKGAPHEMLDGFLAFVRAQGQQMGEAQRVAAPLQALPAPAAGPSPAAGGTAAARLAEGQARLANLLSSLQALANAAPGQPQKTAPAAPSRSSAPAAPIAELQQLLESAVQRARGTAGAPAARRLADAVAADPRLKDEETDTAATAVGVIEPLEQLWRSAQESERVESRQLQAQAEAAARWASSADADKAAGSDPTLALLASQAPRTALLYYLPGDDRLDVLLVSAKGRQAWRIARPRGELEALVSRLQAALRDRFADPRPVAREAYDALLRPLAGALADTGAEVVALSLSGKLRFVPFGALHDGERWLAERYALAVDPGARLTDALRPSAARWTVAAFGASAGGAGLPPLPSVRTELASIVQQGGSGVLPGRAWLDAGFTAPALRGALAADGTVVHIASHFKFEPGDAAASYLLLGDGNRLSLQELGGADYRFDRTELVTLSACQTGLSEDDGFGQEVDGLAALLMAQGAPSVLASLWQVADDSTAALMATFYRLHETRGGERPGPSRAQALQQAQLAMIRGAAPAAADGSAPDEAQRGITRPSAGRARPADGALGRAHPYHWAPFVLMGSWR